MTDVDDKIIVGLQRWWCTIHNVPFVGEPFFIDPDLGDAETKGCWDLDMSNMWCDECGKEINWMSRLSEDTESEEFRKIYTAILDKLFDNMWEYMQHQIGTVDGWVSAQF